MDDIVKQAMTKWPNVPHCYGWLALDARGVYRMRDDQAQQQHLPGDKIAHSALLNFIYRNYVCDEHGRWYFQNGPQRVYVTLETTPYIARTDPVHGFVLHTGEALTAIDEAWMTERGQLVLKSNDKVAMVDDRDVVQCLANLHIDDHAVSDEQLMAWLAQSGASHPLMLDFPGSRIPVRHITSDALAAHFRFVQAPQSDTVEA